MPNFIVIFLTGLLTGGITCTAVQGGLLAALLVGKNEQPQEKKMAHKIYIVLAFVLSKLVSHTVFGFLLGMMGATFQFSIQFTAGMLTLASLFMIGLGLNMLINHPLLRWFVIPTPKFFRSMIWKESKRVDLLAPIILGLLTIFIPCGVTQAMMVQAVGYSSPLTGALTMFFFILGTTPLFIVFGLAISTVSERFTGLFQKFAAAIIIGMAVWNLYNVSTIFGIDTLFKNVIRPLTCQISYCEGGTETTTSDEKTTNTPTISIRRTKYEIDNPNIKAGETITLTVTNVDGGGCIQFFTIPNVGIQKAIPVGKTENFTFTAPMEKGELTYTCSMGMYRGKFIVK